MLWIFAPLRLCERLIFQPINDADDPVFDQCHVNFVAHRERNLSLCAHATQAELAEQGMFLDLLQESGAQHIGNLEGGSNYGFRQIHVRSVCIRVHPWPIPDVPATAKNSHKDHPELGHGWTRMHTDFCPVNSWTLH